MEENKDEVVSEASESSEPVEEVSAPEVSESSEGAAEAVAAEPEKHHGFLGKVDKFFGVSKSGSTFKVEIIAGLTTFMTMVYILMVNAGMFSEPWIGLSYGAAYIATAIGAIAGTLLMALLAKMPLAQASGMGVNAFIVYTLCLSGTNLTYANCMVFTLLDGLIFILLTVTGLRKKIFDAIPAAVRHAITVGIGLFIAFIGMQNAGIIVVDAATLVTFKSFNVLADGFSFFGIIAPLTALIGVIAIAIMSKKNVKGAILWGVLGSAALYFALAGLACIGNASVTYTETVTIVEEATGAVTVLTGDPVTVAYGDWGSVLSSLQAANAELEKGVTWNVDFVMTSAASARSFFDSISISNPITAFGDWGTQAVGKVFTEGFNFSGYTGTTGGLVLLFVTTALSLCMIDMFDTIGTLYGACARGNLLDKDGTPIRMNKMMLADAIATSVGAVAGTSTVTTFVESSAGVAAGGKTGFTALVVAICFTIAMFLSPIAQLIPSAATAAALIWVGVLMMAAVKDVDWTDPADAIIAFLTFIVMVLGYSISKGIGIGIIAYVIVKLCTGKVKEISVPTWVISVVYLATFILT